MIISLNLKNSLSSFLLTSTVNLDNEFMTYNLSKASKKVIGLGNTSYIVSKNPLSEEFRVTKKSTCKRTAFWSEEIFARYNFQGICR